MKIANEIGENIRGIRARVEAACGRVGRDPKEVRIIAVTKTVEPNVMMAMIELGVKDFGENYVVPAIRKIEQLSEMIAAIPEERRPRFHMIGHLQRNKVKKCLDHFVAIHSVDSTRLLREIDRRAAEKGRSISIFLEVKTTSEPTKFGGNPEELPTMLEFSQDCKNLDVVGLMTIAPLDGTPDACRKCFARLRELKEESVESGYDIKWLSMGMTDDYEIAVEEGATHLRIGRAFFKGVTSSE